MQCIMDSESNNVEDCPICLDVLSDSAISTTSCLHKFHNVCIVRWFERHRTCPTCRKRFECSEIMDISGTRPPARPTREAMNMLRLATERMVRAEFAPCVDICFMYTDPNFMSAYHALWFIRVPEGATPNWMPERWRNSLSSRSSQQTREALRLSQEEGVHTIIHSANGVPPRRLYHCRVCSEVVYSDYRLVTAHYALAHTDEVITIE